MRIIQLFLISLLVAASPFSSVAAEGGRATVHAILVIGSNDAGQTDPRLAPYEPNLKSVLRFKSYSFAGENSTVVSAGGTASIQLPSGNSVQLLGEKSGGPGVSVKVKTGGRILEVAPGAPVVLVTGNSGDKGDKFAIIVMVR